MDRGQRLLLAVRIPSVLTPQQEEDFATYYQMISIILFTAPYGSAAEMVTKIVEEDGIKWVVTYGPTLYQGNMPFLPIWLKDKLPETIYGKIQDIYAILDLGNNDPTIAATLLTTDITTRQLLNEDIVVTPGVVHFQDRKINQGRRLLPQNHPYASSYWIIIYIMDEDAGNGGENGEKSPKEQQKASLDEVLGKYRSGRSNGGSGNGTQNPPHKEGRDGS